MWWGATVMLVTNTAQLCCIFQGKERERWQGWKTFKPAEWRVVVLTRGLGERSVQQAPCNIYQLTSRSREENTDRGREKGLSQPLQKPAVDVFKLPLMLQTLSRQSKSRKSRKGGERWEGCERKELWRCRMFYFLVKIECKLIIHNIFFTIWLLFDLTKKLSHLLLWTLCVR